MSDVEFVLPESVVSKAEVSRLVAEVERVDNEMTASSVRSEVEGEHGHSDIMMSKQLTSFVELNNISLDDSNTRSELIRKLRSFKDHLPVIHMAFSSDADRESLQELARWVRESIHKHAVIESGVQPSLVAGVYVRTPNRVHDLSLRSAFRQKHESLVERLGGLRGDR